MLNRKRCSTSMHSVWECEAEASHNAGQGHLERQIYAVQNHVHQGEELLAK